MTANKRFKRQVRRRAAKTGESYTAALRHLRRQREEEAVASTRNPSANCSFCGKGNSEVKKLIAGPGVYICNQCVDLCVEVIAEAEAEPRAVSRSTPSSSERLLAWLSSIAATLRSVEGDIATKVSRLRHDGVAWARIADALGLSEAEAVRRFSRDE